jgi:predicted O-methyltransferase YrrM
MTASEVYTRLTERTDPDDPIVAEEIRKGMRHGYGITDVHHHLPRFREAAHGNVMEIGVRFGASTAALLAGVEDHGGHLYSVDIEDCRIFLPHPQWTFYQMDSVKEFAQLLARVPTELDLLLVDGDHSYNGCVSDLMHFGPRAKIIMVHDATVDENPDVCHAIDFYLTRLDCRHRSASYYKDSHGLAVIQ